MLQDDVVVITAPAVIHVEVVTVWIGTPAGKAVTVVMTLPTYANEVFVLGALEEHPTSTTFGTEPCEFVTTRAQVTEPAGNGVVDVLDLVRLLPPSP